MLIEVTNPVAQKALEAFAAVMQRLPAARSTTELATILSFARTAIESSAPAWQLASMECLAAGDVVGAKRALELFEGMKRQLADCEAAALLAGGRPAGQA